MERNRLRQLLVDYSAGTISKVDLDILLDYVTRHHGDVDLDSLLEELLEDTQATVDLPVDSEILYQQIVKHPRFNNQKWSFKKKYWWYGAAALLLIGGLFMREMNSGVEIVSAPSLEVIHTVTTASSDRPILRLANGRVIDLDSSSNGLLAIEGGTQIMIDGNVIHYEAGLLDSSGVSITNTIITPKGRQYQLILPDSSRILLNAATTLIYPVRFNQNKREVEINGEAYFEVTKAKDWPFMVNTKSQQVEVLGTHFNVSAYADDEMTKTTLVEGRVKVSLRSSFPAESNVHSKIMKPGQQAITSNISTNQVIALNEVDTEEIVSWKQNLFVFSDEEISEVMKKVSRWYDVEVRYRDGMAGKRIGGTIPRFAAIEELMDALQATGLLRYNMEGGRIIIMK